MSFFDDLNERMKGVRQSKWAIQIGIALTILVTVSLTLVTHLWVSQILCLLPMVVAVLAYYMPTYFGLKDRKKLAAFGLVLFLIIGVALGAALYKTIDDYEPQELSSDDNLLLGGLVSPSHGEVGDTYQFTVILASGSNNSTVNLVLYNNWSSNEDETNLTMAYAGSSDLGAIYTTNVSTMSEGIYYFQFKTLNGTSWVETPEGFGPVNADMGKVFTNSLMSGTLYSFYSIAVLFYILILLTWWMDRSKKKLFEAEQQRAKLKEKKKKSNEKFVCSDCGAEVPEESDKCPSCGAKFDDEDRKCPQCAAKLLKSDTRCWNCGRKL